MKHMKMLGLAAVAAMALSAAASSGASATTLELGGAAKNESITISGSLESGTSAIMGLTGGGFVNTCNQASGDGATTSPFTGSTVSGPVSEKSVGGCSTTVTIDKPGTIQVEHIAGSTNGIVRSIGAEVTTASPLGTLNCKTSTGTPMGTLTGKASGQATMNVNVVINCGFLAPSTVLTGTMIGTGKEGLGIVS